MGLNLALDDANNRWNVFRFLAACRMEEEQEMGGKARRPSGRWGRRQPGSLGTRGATCTGSSAAKKVRNLERRGEQAGSLVRNWSG
jgi:hypothetical protein